MQQQKKGKYKKLDNNGGDLKRQDLHGILLKGNLIIFFHMLAK
jgi:hypothetical protein